MSANPDPYARVAVAAAAIAPFLCVFAVRELAMIGRAEARASGPAVNASAESLTVLAPEPAPTPAQARALQWIASQGARTDIPDPMIPPESAPVDHAGRKPGPLPSAQDPDAEASPGLWAVTGLLGGAGNAMIIVDQRVVRLGGEVDNGWVFVHADVRARRVTFEHPDGRRLELSLDETSGR